MLTEFGIRQTIIIQCIPVCTERKQLGQNGCLCRESVGVCAGLDLRLGCGGQWGCRQPSAALAREIDSQPSWHLLLDLGKQNYSL